MQAALAWCYPEFGEEESHAAHVAAVGLKVAPLRHHAPVAVLAPNSRRPTLADQLGRRTSDVRRRTSDVDGRRRTTDDEGRRTTTDDASTRGLTSVTARQPGI